MQLSQLLTALAQKDVQGNLEVEITGLACDSRQVKPGALFVAIKGLNVDGHDFIPQALERGAVAVVVQDARYTQHATHNTHPASCILVPNSRQALAHLA
ncbi:MAG TPA: hypothetical protein EYP49_08160, partial [Anaerolineae bacterium]|nr:hypothetical protein [Anaerolineae bacterium]